MKRKATTDAELAAGYAAGHFGLTDEEYARIRAAALLVPRFTDAVPEWDVIDQYADEDEPVCVATHPTLDAAERDAGRRNEGLSGPRYIVQAPPRATL